MTRRNSSVHLVAYAPDGVPAPSCFELRSRPIPEPGPDELVVEVHYLSMDPFPRLRVRGDQP